MSHVPDVQPPHRPVGRVGRRALPLVHALRFAWLRLRCRGRLRASSTPITAAGVKILPPARVQLGDRVALGRRMYIESDTIVGDDVLFSGYVAIVSNDHPIDGPGTVYSAARRVGDPVVFEGDNLVGYGVIVIAPCRFERGAVAGAGAVVTGTLAADTVHVGVPGRPQRTRQRG